MKKALVLISLCLAGHAAAKVYLQDGFEGYPKAEWNGKLPGAGETVKVPTDSVGFWYTLTNAEISGEQAHSGRASYKITDKQDEDNSWGLWDAVKAGYPNLTEIYIRKYIFFSANYDFPGGGKFMRIFDTQHDPINWDMIELIGCWNDHQAKGVADDFVSWRWEDNRDNGWNDAPEFAITPAKLKRGKWYCLEYHIKLNSPGIHDGVVEVWLDGAQVAKQTDAFMRGKWSSNLSGIGALIHWASNSMGGKNPYPNPQTPSFYYLDDVVISDKYIGPMGALPAMSEPPSIPDSPIPPIIGSTPPSIPQDTVSVPKPQDPVPTPTPTPRRHRTRPVAK